MTRISENQLARQVLFEIGKSRESYNKYTMELSSGYKVTDPGDSKFSATIAQYRELLSRIEGHQTRINAVRGFLSFQDNIASDASELMVRAKELATQAANETVGPEVRAQMAREVFELRDHLISLANSRYQGRYVYGGVDDGRPPYNVVANFSEPASGPASEVYRYDNAASNPGGAMVRSVAVSDEVSVAVNTPGNQIFNNAILALEKLGRALEGYSTSLDPATGLPDGTEQAFNLPDEIALQTQAIQEAITALEHARQNDILPERVSLGARLRRLETAEGLLRLTKEDAQQVLDNLQNVDYATAATNLAQAQVALQASYTVSQQVLRLSILDYL